MRSRWPILLPLSALVCPPRILPMLCLRCYSIGPRAFSQIFVHLTPPFHYNSFSTVIFQIANYNFPLQMPNLWYGCKI